MHSPLFKNEKRSFAQKLGNASSRQSEIQSAHYEQKREYKRATKEAESVQRRAENESNRQQNWQERHHRDMAVPAVAAVTAALAQRTEESNLTLFAQARVIRQRSVSPRPRAVSQDNTVDSVRPRAASIGSLEDLLARCPNPPTEEPGIRHLPPRESREAVAVLSTGKPTSVHR